MFNWQPLISLAEIIMFGWFSGNSINNGDLCLPLRDLIIALSEER